MSPRKRAATSTKSQKAIRTKPARRDTPEVGFVKYSPENKMPTWSEIFSCELYPDMTCELGIAMKRFLETAHPLAVLEAFEIYDRMEVYPDVRLLKWFASKLRKYFVTHSHLDEVLGLIKEGTGNRTLLTDRAKFERDQFICKLAYVFQKHCSMQKKEALYTVSEMFRENSEWKVGAFAFKTGSLLEKSEGNGAFSRCYNAWLKTDVGKGWRILIDEWSPEIFKQFMKQFPAEKLPADFRKYY